MVVQSMVKFVNSIFRFKVPELFRATTAIATALPKSIERGKLIPLKSVYNTMSIHNMYPIIPESSSSINVDNEKISEPTTENEFISNPINSLATETPPSLPTESPSASPATIEKCNIDNKSLDVDKEKAYYYEDEAEVDNDNIERNDTDDADYFLNKNAEQVVKTTNEMHSIYEGSGIKMYVPKKIMTFATKRHNLHELEPGTPNDQRVIFKQKLTE